MTTTQELREALHAQAEEVSAWPAPVVPARVRGDHRHPGRLRAAAVVATVAAVLALVLVPRLVHDAAPSRVAAPGASPTPAVTRSAVPELPASQDWTLVQCPGRTPTCEAPYLIEVGGRELASVAGGGAPTRHGTERTPVLTYTVLRRPGTRYLMVGALGSGPGSRLVVRVAGHVVPLPAGRPSVLTLPPGVGRAQVLLAEEARPLPREQLVVEQYTPVR